MVKKHHLTFVPLVAILLAAIFLISVFMYWRIAIIYQDTIVVNQIEQLSKIFIQIDNDVGIIDFEHHRNYIDFLNVVKFVGSEVGAMNMKKPEHWKGPYLPDNPTYQEKYYEIIKTNKGYYIVPGYGVRLSNKKIIGTDIIYDESIDVNIMMNSKEWLNYQGKPLAAKLIIGTEKPVELPIAVVTEAG